MRTLKKRLHIRGAVKYNEPMSKHTTFCIGGPALIWTEPRDESDLKDVLCYAAKNNLKIFILGAGSNILVDDSGFFGAVINLSASYFKRVVKNGNAVTAGAGGSLSNLVRYCSRHSLCGMEGLVGIPGTVGGALRMNAGNKNTIGNVVREVTVMTRKGRIRTIKAADLDFGYRSSGLSGYIILEVGFKLVKKRAAYLNKKCRMFLDEKRKTQPLWEKSAGCVFKNPTGFRYSAGKLIDMCGLKGRTSGGASISKKHANFIINSSGATSKDVKNLVKLVRTTVKKSTGVSLKRELLII